MKIEISVSQLIGQAYVAACDCLRWQNFFLPNKNSGTEIKYMYMYMYSIQKCMSIKSHHTVQ